MRDTVAPSQAPPDWRHPALLGFAVIVLAFGVFGGWAATTKIKGAIVAQGVVAIETHSKPVQHLEEGIVSEVLVREGDHVEKNQILVRLDGVVEKATLDTYRNELLAARVYEARLLAERDDKTVFTLPPDLMAFASDPVVQKAVSDQQAQFEDRRRALQSQIGVLNARVEGLRMQIKGLKIEQRSTLKQVGYANEELVGLRQLLAQKLVPLNRVLSMEREKTHLEGETGQVISDQARAGNAIGEAQMQIQELRQKFQEDTVAALSDVRQKIGDLQEKQRIAQDALSRVDIRSPVTGTVQNLQVSGAGQVIRSGEVLMEVVPDTETLIVRAEFQPTDISHVYVGQNAEVRFPSFHSRAIPVILGKLASLSRDRIVDEAAHRSYYLGLISVNKLDIPEELRLRLRAGMPAEVIVSSGQRTVLSYLTSPLTEAWQKSFQNP